jgi:hypothetical protein
MNSKEVGVLNLKIEIANELETFWSKMFTYRMQTLCADSQELRDLSFDLEELMNKVESVQNEYLKPVKI